MRPSGSTKRGVFPQRATGPLVEVMDMSEIPSLAEAAGFSTRFFGEDLPLPNVDGVFFSGTVAFEAAKLLANRDRVNTIAAATAIRRILMYVWGRNVVFGKIG
jgi:hypothetical protein